MIGVQGLEVMSRPVKDLLLRQLLVQGSLRRAEVGCVRRCPPLSKPTVGFTPLRRLAWAEEKGF
ncbi:hypothetical protein ABN584_13125 [Gloeocapsa sp. BRSZ]